MPDKPDLAALLHDEWCLHSEFDAGEWSILPELPCVVRAARLAERGVGVQVAGDATRDALEGMARQHAYWSNTVGGIHTGGLSALEHAFDVLGWEDPHPLPERRCDEPGCMEEGTMGWPTRPGGTGLDDGYRRTCWDHSDSGKAIRASETDR